MHGRFMVYFATELYNSQTLSFASGISTYYTSIYVHRILTIYKFKNNLTEFNLDITQDAEMIYRPTSVSQRQTGESKNCFTRLVKSTTIWTIILDPLNS